MIITCNNCNKNFDIESNLISDKGRLLQCASCDHKWFFKKEALESTVSPVLDNINTDSVNIFDQIKLLKNKEINPSDLQKDEIKIDTKEKLDKKILINTKEKLKKTRVSTGENTQIKAIPKTQKNFKIFNIFIVAIISFVAFIIIVDTFKYPIGQVVPNVEFILYNLYESIKDISLFIKDLI